MFDTGTLPTTNTTMLTILTVLMLAAPPAKAPAGKQAPQTITLWQFDNTQHELTIGPKAAWWAPEAPYKRVSPGTYQRVSDPVDACPNGQPGKSTYVLGITATAVVETTTHWFGCGEDALQVWTTFTARYLRKKVPKDKLCKRQGYDFRRKKRTLKLKDHCDGTLLAVIDDETQPNNPLTLSSSDGKHWKGSDFFMTHPPERFTIELTWKRGDKVAVLDAWASDEDGQLRSYTGHFKLVGTWAK